jgi:uracil-DNA glycosylase family 4
MKLIQAGPRDSKIMLVGEAPTSVEEATGTPFTGGAGSMLSHMLSRGGISHVELLPH